MGNSFFCGKKILVTGHTGFKGSWLCETLLHFGANVVGYALKPPTKPNLFGLLHLQDRMRSYIGDIRDFETLEKVISSEKPEFVIHMAAQPLVLEGYRIPRETYEINVMGTVNVLDCVRECRSIRSFLNVTTDKVYLNEDVPDHPFKEEEPLDGHDPYSNSKSCSELVTHSYKKSFFSAPHAPAISTARAGNVIGGGDFSANRIIPDAVNAAKRGKHIVVRNKNSTRPYQFVLEPLYAYLLILMKQFLSPDLQGYYNVGPDKEDFVKTGDLVQLFCDKWGGCSWVDRPVPGAPHEAGFLSLDNEKIKQKFGWKPVLHIENAMDYIVEWSKVWAAGEDVREITDRQIERFFEGIDL